MKPSNRIFARAARMLVLGASLTLASPAIAGIKVDLSRIDQKSSAYKRFRSWVDAAVDGRPGYAFSATDATLMFRLTGVAKYCELAVTMVEQQVTEAEAEIAKGGRPKVAGDSYLEVGPMIAELAHTFDACGERLSPEQKLRWSAYAEQAVWNVWDHKRAHWGGTPHAWTGWSTDNPGNNYYYSFVEATMTWALASGDKAWLRTLRQEKLPPLRDYVAKLPGGGSREGTGYGAAHMRLFALYRLWRDSTDEDLANATPHLTDTINYWIHATVPTLDRFAPLGDQSRNSVPEIYDYHRRLVLEAAYQTNDEATRAAADWWLSHISMKEMSGGFNYSYDLLASHAKGAAPTAQVYVAEGTGHLFARTGWDRDAMWLAFVAGPYEESHAHQDQGGFTLFAGDWLTVTENIWSHSGIQQGPEVHNVVRFERADRDVQQCQSPPRDRVVHLCYPTRSTLTIASKSDDGSFSATADLTPAFRDNPALDSWQRQLDFAARKLTVRDRFELGEGTRAIFQLNVPTEPKIDGQTATAGRLRVKVIEPANAVLSVHDWRSVDKDEFRRGWRLDVAGGDTGYVVELDEVE